MKKLSTLLIAVLVAAGLLRMCVYTVNEREYALVFALGELKTVISEPGLHVKLPPPLQNIVYLDKRILNLDAAGADLVQTSEKKNLLIDTFVKWRIEDPPLLGLLPGLRTRCREPRLRTSARRAQRGRQQAHRQPDHVLRA